MKYSAGWKYRNHDGMAYKLQFDYGLPEDHNGRFLILTSDNWLLIMDGYSWNGANCFPDFDWIKTPSLIHDALLELVAEGILPESLNDQIDREIEEAISGNKGKQWLLKFRGWYVKRGTNLVETRKGDITKVLSLSKLKRELTISEYQRITGR
jgi:hypothetical protein